MEDAAPPVAITDTSPLIALSQARTLEVLCLAFRELRVPLSVWIELTALPDAQEPVAVAALPCVRLVPDVSVPPFLHRLDVGERQVLAIGQRTAGCMLLLDDSAGRRAARQAGLAHVGTVGLVALAKKYGVCSSARDRFELLLQAGFRIDLEVVNQVLDELGEPRLAAR